MILWLRDAGCEDKRSLLMLMKHTSILLDSMRIKMKYLVRGTAPWQRNEQDPFAVWQHRNKYVWLVLQTLHFIVTKSEGIRRSRGSSVNIETGIRAGRPGFNSRQWLEIFSSPPRPDRLWGPPI